MLPSTFINGGNRAADQRHPLFMPTCGVPSYLTDLGQRAEIMMRLHQALVAFFVPGRDRFDSDLAQVHSALDPRAILPQDLRHSRGKFSIGPNHLVRHRILETAICALSFWLYMYGDWTKIRNVMAIEVVAHQSLWMRDRARPSVCIGANSRTNPMNWMIQTTFALTCVVVLSSCGSAYSGLSNVSGLGAGQYRPAVVVEPGNEARYEQVLGICRSVAANRQATAAQKAQLESITGVVAGAGTGAAAGLQFGSMLGNAGFDTSAGEGALVGAAAGAVSGLAAAFASGAEDTADETRRILLNCLRQTSKSGTLWQVVE